MAERQTPIKKRSSSCYENKINKLTKKYNHLIAERKREPEKINPNTKLPVKRTELKPLDYYIGLLKKPKGE
jgi:hypothetical protein